VNILLSKQSYIEQEGYENIGEILSSENLNKEALKMLDLRSHKGNIPLNFAAELGN